MDEIEIAFTLRPDPDETLGRYVLAFEGQATVWDEDASEERPAGIIRGHRIDLVAALCDGIGQDELLDSLTPEVSEFARAVLADSRCLLPAGEDLEATACDCLIYIAELWVESAFRGQGLGTMLLRRLGATIDLERCLLALKARPIREDPKRIASPDEIARVKRFYERNGFGHAGGDFMFKDARRCEAMKKRLAGRRIAG